VKTGRKLQTLKGDSAEILSLSFSADGQIIASSSDKGTVRPWNLNTGKICQINCGWFEVWSIAFSPDSEILAAGTDGGIIALWDVKLGEARLTLKCSGQPVNTIVFSPDGQFVASSFTGHRVLIWDIKTRNQVSWEDILQATKEGL
jgi:WD40 repeat protein